MALNLVLLTVMFPILCTYSYILLSKMLIDFTDLNSLICVHCFTEINIVIIFLSGVLKSEFSIYILFIYFQNAKRNVL